MLANVLIVCHANVCRSPAAEWLFRARQRSAVEAEGQARRAIRFHSAGIRAVDGWGMDPMMRRLLAERGITPGMHQSRRIDRQIVRDADLILVTEHRQVKVVEALEPTSHGKVFPLGTESDVTDPYGRAENEYRASLVLIEHLVMGWLNKIC